MSAVQNAVSSWAQRKRATLREDVLAGLIVAIIAVPLSIGYAIASGIDPVVGLYTAAIGGFLAALLGGSEYLISGPSGGLAAIVLLLVAQHGMQALILTTVLAGIILIFMGVFRLGKLIEYFPSPIIVGYIAGTAGIIFFGQLNNFLGIVPTYPAGTDFIHRTLISLQHVGSAYFPAILLGLLTLAIIIFLPRVHARIPVALVALLLCTLLVMFVPFFSHVRLIRDISSSSTAFPMPDFAMPTWELVREVLPEAFTIAILIAVESLLTAVIADGLTDKRHKPNRELVGQGISNIFCGLFGLMPSDGAASRTVASIANGAKSRTAAIMQSLFILFFVLVAGEMVALVPLPALAGLLFYVSYRLVDWQRFLSVLRTPLSDVVVMLTTFLLTVFVSLTLAMEVGAVLASFLFMKRMSDLYHLESFERTPTSGSDTLVEGFSHPDISIYTIHGPLFFGAASRLEQELSFAPGGRKPIKIIRMKHVPVIDATGLNFLLSAYKKHTKLKGVVLFSAVHPDVMRIIQRAGIDELVGKEHFFPTTRAALAHALKHAHRYHGEPETVSVEELEKYKLSVFDSDESIQNIPTRDKDPVQDILDSVGITYLANFGQKTLHDTMKTMEPLGHSITKTGKVLSTPLEKTLKETKHITKKVLGDKDAMIKGKK